MEQTLADILAAFEGCRQRLSFVVSRQMNHLLGARLSVEDVLQETLLAVTRHVSFFDAEPDVPLYFKFRKIAMQTLADLERRHIKYEKRSTLKEVSGEAADKVFGEMRAEVRSPRTVLSHKERDALLRALVNELPETDRQIIGLRNFDAMSNAECADVLGIDPKAASIRYVRALRRLHERLKAISEFQP